MYPHRFNLEKVSAALAELRHADALLISQKTELPVAVCEILLQTLCELGFAEVESDLLSQCPQRCRRCPFVAECNRRHYRWCSIR